MKRALAIVVLVGMIAGSAVYFYRASQAPAHPGAAPGAGVQAAPVTVATARRRAMRSTLQLVGTLRADRQAAISTRFPGRILEITVQDGARVRRGQVLARLDLGSAPAQVAGARAAVAAADAQLRKAVAGKSARRTEMDSQIAQSQGGLRNALAKLSQARLAVELTDSSAKSDAARAAAAVRQAEAGLRQAEAGLAQANDALGRMKFLYAHGGIARTDLEGAQAQADIAKAQRDAAQAGVEQARAASQPAADSAPLRTKVSQMDVQAAEAGVAQAEAGLRSARRARADALRIADRDVEAAQAQVAQAQAGVQQAQGQVGASELTSPYDGIVTGITARAGEMAQPGMPLMSVTSPSTVYLEAPAAARNAGAVHPGDAAHVTVDTLPGQMFDGYVEEVLPVSSDNRTVPVRLRVEAGKTRLVAGTGASAELDVSGGQNAVSVPVDALRSEGSTSFVFVVTGGKASRRNVTVGATEGAYAQILTGLTDGDTVILTGPASLQEGAAVTVVGR